MKEVLSAVLPFWENLSGPERAALLKETVGTHFHEQTVIYHFDRNMDPGVNIITEGSVRMYLLTPGGDELTLFHMPAVNHCVMGMILKEQTLGPQIGVHIAAGTEVLTIPSSLYQRLIRGNPHVYHFYHDTMACALQRIIDKISSVAFVPVRRRLVETLFERSQMAADACLYVTHEALAYDIGAAREVVSRFLKQLERNGLVALSRGCVKLLDEGRLKVVLEELDV